MSAIYGFVGDGDMSLLGAMGDNLAHRGDKCYEWSPAPKVFLGLRSFDERSTDGDLCQRPSVASAQIYNREEIISRLRKTLDEAVDDQDLIQASYESWGTECFQQFNGDFVVAIWDDQEQRLMLARDPLGVRAVYYFAFQGFIAFASEYKAFLSLDRFIPAPDLDTIQYFQATKYLPVEKTLLRNVCSVPAGNFISYSQHEITRHRYWDIRVEPGTISEATAEEELRRLFLGSLEKRIASVDKLGAELSGGIDSSAVVGALRRLRPVEEIKTFTIGSGPDDPEILMARLASDFYKTEHHEIFVDPENLAEDLPGFVWHLEDPVGRTEGYLYYKLTELASSHVDFIFGGTASDGLFAGMPRYKVIRLMQYMPFMRRPLEEFYHYTQSSYMPHSAFGKAIKGIYFGKDALPCPRISGAAPISSPDPLQERREGLLNNTLRKGVLYGGPNSLTKAEKAHMAYGIEFRSPFTDVDIVRYAFKLPEKYKLHGFKEKYILRRALQPFVPDEIINRPKFPQRMEYDASLSNAIESLAEQYLNIQRVRERGFFTQNEIEALRNRPAGKPYPSRQAMQLWTAIVTEVWAEIFLDRSIKV